MRFVTERTARSLSAVQGMDRGARERIFAIAARVLAHVSDNEWIDGNDLAAWAQGNGITPDELNASTALLEQTKRLVILNEASILPPPIPKDLPDVADMTLEQLQERARVAGIAGRSSMTKNELIVALSGDPLP